MSSVRGPDGVIVGEVDDPRIELLKGVNPVRDVGQGLIYSAERADHRGPDLLPAVRVSKPLVRRAGMPGSGSYPCWYADPNRRAG